MQVFGRQVRVGSWLEGLLSDATGQSVTEYAVIMAVITLVAVASISPAGQQTLDALRRVATNRH